MKLLDINGRQVSVGLYSSKNNIGKTERSKLQTIAGECLKNKYPHEQILEDYIIPSSRLSVDFFIPRLKIVIEVNGVQHEKFSPFFHGERTQNKYTKQVFRDVKKQRWAEMNGFKFYTIVQEEDLEQL